MTIPTSPATNAAVVGNGGRRLAALTLVFQLTGLLSLVATLGQTTALLLPRVHWSVTPSLGSLLHVVLFTVASFGTSRLIAQRRRDGALVVGAWFLAPVSGFVTGDPPTAFALLFAAAGILTTASLWRRLR